MDSPTILKYSEKDLNSCFSSSYGTILGLIRAVLMEDNVEERRQDEQQCHPKSRKDEK